MWDLNLMIQFFFFLDLHLQQGGKNNGKIICIWNLNERTKSA